MGLLTTSENFTEINMALDRCCELAHKLQVPNKQMALITDARFTANGYDVLIVQTINERNNQSEES